MHAIHIFLFVLEMLSACIPTLDSEPTVTSLPPVTTTIPDPCPMVCPDIYSPMCYGGYGYMCLDAMMAMVAITYDPMTSTCTMTFTCPGPQLVYVQDSGTGVQSISPGLTSITCQASPAMGWIVPATMQSIDGLVCNDMI